MDLLFGARELTEQCPSDAARVAEMLKGRLI